MTRSFIQTQAIVLKKRSFASRDAVFTLLTESDGKLAVFGKNVKSLTGRRIAHLQTGNLVQVALQSRGDAHYLQETTLVSAFSAIKKDRKLLDSAYMFFFIVDRLLPEHEPDSVVYAQTLRFLSSLAGIPKSTESLLEESLNALMHTLGYSREVKPLSQLLPEIEALIHEKVPGNSI